MMYKVTSELLKVRLNDERWAERRHLDDGYWFYLDGMKTSYSDIAGLSSRKPEFIKGLVDGVRSLAIQTRRDRARLIEVQEFVKDNDGPLLGGIKRILARKYIT